MEKVKDLILYQIVKNRHFKVGDKIIFNENTITGQYEKVFQKKYQIENIRLANLFYDFKQNKKIVKKNIRPIAYLCDDYDLLVRELAVEKIRKEYYKERPSRLHCMYLSLSKETALINFEKSREKHLQAVAVKLKGKIFKCGNFMLDRNGGSFEDYEKMAHAYWSQADVADADVKEILFEGEAEIVEILKER